MRSLDRLGSFRGLESYFSLNFNPDTLEPHNTEDCDPSGFTVLPTLTVVFTREANGNTNQQTPKALKP